MKLLKYGILYFRDKDFRLPSVFRVHGIKRTLEFNEKSSPALMYEFLEICINDCYNLEKIHRSLGEVKSIVDVGANQGLFALAARSQYPNATITCYEPNEQLRQYLHPNAVKLSAIDYYEAVTKDDCKVLLDFGDTDLHTQTRISNTGRIPGTSLRKVIERAGGKIDILKLDCEGAEWALLEDESAWENIGAVTMEYHLWAKESSNTTMLIARLKDLQFEICTHAPVSPTFGIITAMKQKAA